MTIRFTTSVAGMNFAYRHKQVVTLSAKSEQEFVRAGQAEVVEPEVPGIRRRRRGALAIETAERAGGVEAR